MKAILSNVSGVDFDTRSINDGAAANRVAIDHVVALMRHYYAGRSHIDRHFLEEAVQAANLSIVAREMAAWGHTLGAVSSAGLVQLVPATGYETYEVHPVGVLSIEVDDLGGASLFLVPMSLESALLLLAEFRPSDKPFVLRAEVDALLPARRRVFPWRAWAARLRTLFATRGALA